MAPKKAAKPAQREKVRHLDGSGVSYHHAGQQGLDPLFRLTRSAMHHRTA